MKYRNSAKCINCRKLPPVLDTNVSLAGLKSVRGRRWWIMEESASTVRDKTSSCSILHNRYAAKLTPIHKLGITVSTPDILYWYWWKTAAMATLWRRIVIGFVYRQQQPCSLETSEMNESLESNIIADNGSHFVTHHSADPWPAWPVTHDPIPDHGMSRSRLLTNHDVQSGILGIACAVYTCIVYTVKSSSLHSSRQFLQAENC